jgi:hypothetical protein
MESTELVRPQCEARSKRTGVQCKRPSLKDTNVCEFHGGLAGRPIIHGKNSRFLERLPVEYQHTFIDFLEDFNPVQVLALLQTYLVMEIDSIARAINRLNEAEDDPEEYLKMDRRLTRDLESASRNATRTIESIVKAREAVVGKKVVVSFTNHQIPEEIKYEANKFLNQFLSWLPGVLCERCRATVADELANRQQTILDADEEF